MEHQELLNAFEQRKNKHLMISIGLDLLGMASYLLPVLGEVVDFVYAPIYGIAIFSMYRLRGASAAVGGVGGFLEEFAFGDIIPSASIMWAYHYYTKREETLMKFVQQKQRDYDAIEQTLNPQYSPQSTGPGFFKRLGTSILSVFYEFPQEQLPPGREEAGPEDVEWQDLPR